MGVRLNIIAPTREQLLYRTDLHPTLKKISNIALAVIGATSLVALRYLSARAVIPVALTSAFIAWIFPHFIELPPNFDLVHQLGITEEVIEGFSEQAKKGDFTNFALFLDTFTQEHISLLKHSCVLQSIIPLIEEGVKQDKIKESVLKKIESLFRPCGIFNDRYFRPDMKIISKDGKIFPCNKTILSMASPYFHKAMYGTFREGQSQSITLQELSADAVRGLLYFAKGEKSSNLPFAAHVELMRFCKVAMMEEGLTVLAEKQLVESAKKCSSTQQLETFLETFHDCATDQYLEGELITKLISIAFTSFLKSEFSFKGSFRFTEDLFTIPLEALHLLGQENFIGHYLREHVNCITITQPLTEQLMVRLRTVNILLKPQVKDKITALQFLSDEKFKKRDGVNIIRYENTPAHFYREEDFPVFKSFFPQINRACLTLSNKIEYNRDLDFISFLSSLSKKGISKRELVFGEFESPQLHLEIKNSFQEMPTVHDLEIILEHATDLVHFTEATKIVMQGFPTDRLKTKLTQLLKKKLEIKSFKNCSQFFNRDSFILSVEFGD